MELKSEKYSQVINSRNSLILASKVRTAQRWKDRLIGLLGTKILKDNCGLWLKPCRGIHTIGMRYAIDVIFIDKTYRVLKTEENLAPFRICRAFRDSHSVLEFPIGTIARVGIKVGDNLIILNIS